MDKYYGWLALAIALGVILGGAAIHKREFDRRRDVEIRLQWLEDEVMFLEQYHGCASDAGAPVRGELSTDD